MIRWKVLVELGKYFGVIDERDANIFVDSDSRGFEFNLDQDERLWVSSQRKKTKKDKPSN